ncbi:hypothetical protein NKH17_18715 [Mesorhizobium sp. M1334]|uniref:hypothetical protein n=1 Tax=Mesorhizobium sp. M1334 TaxID=2957084 RepID=UPI00333CBA00
MILKGRFFVSACIADGRPWGSNQDFRIFAIPEEQAAGYTVPNIKLLTETDSRKIELTRADFCLAQNFAPSRNVP